VTDPVVISVVVMAVVLAAARRRPVRRLRRIGQGDGHRPLRLPLPAALRRRREVSSARRHMERQDVADLVGRLAALTRAGVASGRAWQVLAEGSGPASRVARTTSDMLASGGTASDGLRLAIRSWPPGPGPPGALDAVGWLALATEVIDRSGAPSAAVYDGLAEGVLAELARVDEEEVALTSARTTAALLAALPLAGAGLGFAMGVNVVGVLVGTPIGRVCLVLGIAAWLCGRRWTRHLVDAAASATP
jgi:tight adherence protein B